MSHKNLNKAFLWIALTLLVAGLSFTAGAYTTAHSQTTLASQIPFVGSPPIYTSPPTLESNPPLNLEKDFAVFWDVWQLIETEFFGNPDHQKMIRGAVRGMLEGLGDPYTQYIDPQYTRILREDDSGRFQGIGAMVEMVDGKLTIISTMKNSPAEHAGLKSGDVVLEVDGQSVEDLNLIEAVTLVRGPAGTTVTLTIQREGLSDPLSVTVTRAAVELTSVESRMLTEKIGYLAIRNFNSRTVQELDDQLLALQTEGAQALILDLRGNPGGFLDAAVETVSRFVDNGPALWWENADGSTRPIYVKKRRTFNWPIVVLVDKASASASEIVAGALQDSGRAILIGTPTFGKGSVQNVHLLRDGGSVRVTTAHWLTRDKHEINGVGIEPDLLVEQEESHPELDNPLDFARRFLEFQVAPPVDAAALEY